MPNQALLALGSIAFPLVGASLLVMLALDGLMTGRTARWRQAGSAASTTPK